MATFSEFPFFVVVKDRLSEYAYEYKLFSTESFNFEVKFEKSSAVLLV